MLFANPQARRQPYDDALRKIMNADRARECRRWLSSWHQLHPGATPLWSLPRLSQQMSLAQIEIKDESKRSPLGSFKVLGAPVALLRLILRQRPDLQPADLLAGRHADVLRDLVVVSATDGNHGRALAAAAHRAAGARTGRRYRIQNAGSLRAGAVRSAVGALHRRGRRITPPVAAADDLGGRARCADDGARLPGSDDLRTQSRRHQPQPARIHAGIRTP